MESNGSPHRNLSSQLVCPTCHRQFSRLEHLKRHARVHDKEKPYTCQHCNKAFGRKDAAQRHEHGHASTTQPSIEEEAAAATASTTAPKASLCKTCCPCADARIKCSGGTPCSYCSSRSLNCIYRVRKRKRSPIAPLHETLNDAEDATSNMFDNNSTMLSAEVGGVQSPDFNTVNEQSNAFTATNWLPFTHPAAENRAIPQHGINVNHIPATESNQYTLQVVHDTTPSFPEVTQNQIYEEQSTLQHDQVSALITSMNTGIPGVAANNDSVSQHALGLQRRGEKYVDSIGARRSRLERRKIDRGGHHTLMEEYQDVSPNSDISWVDVLEEKLRQESDNTHSTFQIPDTVHAELMLRICPNDSARLIPTEYQAYQNILFRKEVWTYFIRLYFENFHRFHPFLERSLLSIPVWGWALCLAAAAIGTRFCENYSLTLYGDSLCFALHNILLKELDYGTIEDSLPYIQARALAAIGLCHSRQTSLLNCGYNAITLVMNSCQRLRLLEEDERIGVTHSGQDMDQVWISWRFRETRRRTGLFLCIADCMFAAMSGSCPRLPHKFLNLKLPCSENLWTADTSEKWCDAYALATHDISDPAIFDLEEKSRLTVKGAIQKLWTHQSLLVHVADFASTAIINTLLSRLWDAVQYFNDPQYSWSQSTISSAEDEKEDSILPYIAANKEFSRWRSGVCDCLDVLHWDALSQSAKNEGHEGPVFLQLHLARLLVLTPYTDLLGHLRSFSKSSNNILPHEIHSNAGSSVDQCKTIITWAREDRYKARLAIIHAGAIFWHVRRYPSETYVQPFAVYLAAAVLWAFGLYSETKSNSSLPSRSDSLQDAEDLVRDSIDDRMPPFMQLDRPMDDELVQYFIRSGRMQLLLERVPDLCSSQGPAKVLQEAAKILSETAGIWTVAGSYVQCLEAAAVSVVFS